MYPKNAASPEPVAIGPVVQISDGAVQTSGVTVRIKPNGVAEADGTGTTSYSTDGIVYYTPVQSETNYTSFILIAKKTGCIPVSVTVVTTASATSGKVVLSGETHTSAVIPTVTTLTGHTAQTGDTYALANGAAGFVVIDNVVDSILEDTDELQTDDVPGLIAALNDFDPVSDAVANVTLVATTTTNTDMVAAAPSAATVAAAVEAAILDEGDATALLASIAAKVEQLLINEGDATATIAAIATACNVAITAGQVGTDAVAIRAITDQFKFTVANQVDANALSGGGGGGGGSGSGIHALTVTCQEADETTVQGARVAIEGTTSVETTKNDGTVVFNLNPGTYTLVTSQPAGYGTPDNVEVTVPDELVATVTMVPRSSSTPAGPGLCAIDAYVRLGGIAIVGAKVKARLLGTKHATEGVIQSTVVNESLTDENGFAVLHLVRKDSFVVGKGIYLIEITHGDNLILSLKTSIPNVDSVNLEDLLITV